MTQMEGGPKLFATGPVPDDLAVPTALAEQAHPTWAAASRHRDNPIRRRARCVLGRGKRQGAERTRSDFADHVTTCQSGSGS